MLKVDQASQISNFVPNVRHISFEVLNLKWFVIMIRFGKNDRGLEIQSMLWAISSEDANAELIVFALDKAHLGAGIESISIKIPYHQVNSCYLT